MIRYSRHQAVIRVLLSLSLAAAAGSLATDAYAQAKKKKGGAAPGGPVKLETYGKWEVYATPAGRSRLCYALSRPQKRLPANLKRDDGYIFISTRPAQNVRNEVAIKMGYDVKPDSSPNVNVGKTKFEMVANGADLFVKNAAQERTFVAALRKSGEIVVHASSKRGNNTTDTYSLSGISQALDRVAKECK